MTKEEFLAALAETADKYEWHNEGRIRALRTAQTNKLYVAVHAFCPITAVYHAQTNKFYSVGMYHNAAEALGLSEWLTYDITFATDHVLLMGMPHIRKLRNEVLTALNVQEIAHVSEEETSTAGNDEGAVL